MNELSIILIILGGLFFLEGAIVSIFPKSIKTIVKKKNTLRKAGIFETLGGLVLLILGLIFL